MIYCNPVTYIQTRLSELTTVVRLLIWFVVNWSAMDLIKRLMANTLLIQSLTTAFIQNRERVKSDSQAVLNLKWWALNQTIANTKSSKSSNASRELLSQNVIRWIDLFCNRYGSETLQLSRRSHLMISQCGNWTLQLVKLKTVSLMMRTMTRLDVVMSLCYSKRHVKRLWNSR